jgi:sugar phosphate isomerase/epimerase
MEKWPIGVFTSIDAGLGVSLAVVRELGIPTIQLHAPSKETRRPERAEQFLAQVRELGIEPTAVFGGFAGESYADIPTVVRTVGLVPSDTRAARLEEMKEISDYARILGVKVVALHLGFVPHDTSDPLYHEVLAVTRELCDYVKKNGQDLHLETGQETADTLVRFIKDVQRDNLFVNFDPANMILYGSGEPLEALEKVGPWVHSVHIKDAKWAPRPGEEWGTETPAGDGDVGMENFLRTLDKIGYTGPLTIEREIPHEPDRQKLEIGKGVRLLNLLKAKLAAEA